jgi:hypothetical protein
MEGKMKKYSRFLSAAMTLVLVSNTTSFVWNGRGHMMVAAVAYNKLTQRTKDRVEALLLLNQDWPNWLPLIPPSASLPRSVSRWLEQD